MSLRYRDFVVYSKKLLDYLKYPQIDKILTVIYQIRMRDVAGKTIHSASNNIFLKCIYCIFPIRDIKEAKYLYL